MNRKLMEIDEKVNEMVKFRASCHWSDHCATYDGDFEVASVDGLLDSMEEMFDEACGISAVESFDASCQEADGGWRTYFWDNEKLKRNKNLSDVWSTEREGLRECFEDMFRR